MAIQNSGVSAGMGQTKGQGEADVPARSAGASAPLPCLYVTTAPKEEVKPLPGPKQKQAFALGENIKWMAETFGKERIGFFTLTVGDVDTGGKFRNLRDRKKAQRRFHSLHSHVIAKRYLCGVVVTERHKNGGIHFHAVVACRDDIRGRIVFAACFPPKDSFGKLVCKPDYSTANDAIKREWAFWRYTAKKYGFGRHQLQPMRENGEALGHYLGDYLKKDWSHRWPEDKGVRCIRYFGQWSKQARRQGERKTTPPFNPLFGWMTPKARMWRELVSQVATVARFEGMPLAETTVKELLGPKWAWKLTKLFKVTRFEVGEWQAEAVQLAIQEHNLEVRTAWIKAGGDPARDCWWHITEITLDHLRPSPAWKKQMAELQLAKECEAEIRKRLKALEQAKRDKAEQWQLLMAAADSLEAEKEAAMKEEQQRFLGLLGQVPARLTAEQVAWALNCQPSDVPILVAARLLKPLGSPPPNSVKFFAAAEVLEQAKDRQWLAKISNALNQHWQKKNAAKHASLV